MWQDSCVVQMEQGSLNTVYTARQRLTEIRYFEILIYGEKFKGGREEIDNRSIWELLGDPESVTDAQILTCGILPAPICVQLRDPVQVTQSR